MAILDIFNSQAFSAMELTDAINVVPNKYGRLQQLNIFPARGVRTRTVAVERQNQSLNLLPTVPIGGPATKGTVSKRDLRNFTIPHIPHEDVVLAEELQGVRAFGSENQLRAFQDLVNEKMMTMRDKHAITLEYLRWGAITGQVLDADGSTLLNLFTEFSVTEKSINFALTTSTTEVLTKIHELKRHMETNLFGETMSIVHVFCSPEFFDALVTHASVKEAYKYFRNTQTALSADYRNRFEHAGVVFEEHVGVTTNAAGTEKKFIAANKARAIPLGTQNVFKTYFAPADFIETVNTPGMELYAKQRRMDYDRGIEVHTQSNPLPICLRPQLLVELTKS